MEKTNAFQLEHPRLMKALLALIGFSTMSSMLGLIGRGPNLMVIINLLVLVLMLGIPWWHYVRPSCIGEVVVEIWSVVQGIVGAWYMAETLEPILFEVRGPGKWLALLLAQLFNVAFSAMLFKAAKVCLIDSGAQTTMEWLEKYPKDRQM